jgi:hypothetical protein
VACRYQRTIVIFKLSISFKKNIMKKLFLVLSFPAILLSCKKEKNSGEIFTGRKVAVAQGKAWTWLHINKEGTPQQLAITIDDAALHSLSTGGSSERGQHHPEKIIIPLHQKAIAVTPFKFIGADWNPAGHDGPNGVYEKPHFDFHYYLLEEAQIAAATDPAKLNLHPEPGYLPQNYVPGPPVPQMGKHWIDVTSPELNGMPFTETFIYGSYDGRINFYEPMITLDFLKSTNLYQRSIPQPSRFRQTGYYPAKLVLLKHDGLTEIIFDDFVFRQAD